MTLERTVPLWRKAGYGAGSVADSIYFYAWDLLVLFYYTQVLGLPGTLTGAAILVALSEADDEALRGRAGPGNRSETPEVDR